MKMVTDETAPELTESEVIERFVSRALPERWSFRLQKPMRPLYQEGQLVLVGRGFRRVGALVGVPHCGRLAWRRAIARSDMGVLLRAEVSPFVDGWFSRVVGSIEPAGLAAKLAEKLPDAWVRFWWTAAWLDSRARGRCKAARHSREGRACFRVRRLTSADREGYLDLMRREYGNQGSLVQPVEFPAPDALGLGLFLGDTLVGCCWLGHHQEAGVISSLLVDSRHRGRGGGTLLYRAALGEARAAGMRRAQAAVFVRNLPSLRAAERAGLRRTGRWVTDPADRLHASEMQLLVLEAQLGSP